MKTEERVLKVYSEFDGKVFNVKKYLVELPDGSTAFREEVHHCGGACAICEEDGQIYFVSQFRLSAKTDLLEIPAGKVETGEDPLDAAKRELAEETGVLAEKLKLITAVYASPGYSDEMIYIYHCEKFRRVKQKLDDGEFLNVVKIPCEKAFEMMEKGEIKDGKTVIALMYLKNLKSGV